MTTEGPAQRSAGPKQFYFVLLLTVFFCAGRKDSFGDQVQLPCKSVDAFSNGVRISIANYKQVQTINTPPLVDSPLRLCAFARALYFWQIPSSLGLLTKFGLELIKDVIFRVIKGLEE